MSDAIPSWVERASAASGVLACGVRRADRTFLVNSCREELAEATVTQAMRDLSEVVYALQQNRVPTEYLRWTFENGQIHCVTRPGGIIAALLVNKEMADSPHLDQLLADFEPTPA